MNWRYEDDVVGEKQMANNEEVRKYTKLINEIMKLYNVKTYTINNHEDTFTIITLKEEK